MKALYTADVHGDLEVWRQYAQRLRSSDYRFGLVGGDLSDDSLTLSTIKTLSGAENDDLLEELYEPEDTVEALEGRIHEYKARTDTPLWKAAKQIELEIKDIVGKARKPIYLIPGNHDLSDWSDEDLITNVNSRRVEVESINIVGYRFTTLEKSELSIRNELRAIRKMVNSHTILMTHSPAYRVLDRNYRGHSIGSRAVGAFVRQRRPLFHLVGHVHDSFGVDGYVVNGSYATGRAFFEIDIEARRARAVPG